MHERSRVVKQSQWYRVTERAPSNQALLGNATTWKNARTGGKLIRRDRRREDNVCCTRGGAPVHFQHQEHSPEKGAKPLSATRTVNASCQVAARPPRNGTESHNQRADSSDTARTRQANTESMSLESEATPQERPNTRKLCGLIDLSATETIAHRISRRRCPNTVNSSASNAHANLLIRLDVAHDHFANKVVASHRNGGTSRTDRW